MSDLAVAAEVKRMQLICGLISVPEIVKWAETTLGEVEYEDNLANVALATEASQPEMVTLLGELAAGADRLEAICKVMSSMHGALSDDPSLAAGFAGVLKEFAAEHEDALPEDLGFMTGLDDTGEQLMNELSQYADNEC